ncbi:LppX_LprAFG lipoprotein [Actinomadura darangshiensis]|uniref:LppX_LprAFG lipoprotein n=1 Tax=Actinomadura darangshiensis TaxID=705336 RepID=A0A4R5BNA4_9ACTN|nr:LppX_LprAFG lipoprotein [Actinomadura darangshiensis]TDD85374.1 LppX_LprAFG lipoprotein [Actinomadura darangshiensis]
MIRRFAAGAALATGLALSLTGCFGDPGKTVDEAGKGLKLSAAQVLGKAAEKTGQTDSFKADLNMQMTGGSGPTGDVSANGTMQYRTKPDLAYSMNFADMSAGGKSIGAMEQRLVGRNMYIKMGMLSQLTGGTGKPWMKISLDEIGAKSGMNIDQLLQQSRQMDPVQNTKMLTASKDAREVGKETIDGVETTHYTGTYRMEDAIAKLSPEMQEAYRKNASSTGMEAMHFDLWVDGQQLPRQMTMKSLESASQNMTMTMKYHDFGKPVDITEPPASQVSDFGDLLGKIGTGAGAGIPGS